MKRFCNFHSRFFPEENSSRRVSEFRLVKNDKYVDSYCYRCRLKYQQQCYLKRTKNGFCGRCCWRKSLKGKVVCKPCLAILIDYQYKRKYNLTTGKVKEKQRKQKNRCAICMKKFTETPRVDHDHVTGKNRDLLCDACNVGLSKFKDSPLILRNAAKYIEKHKRRKANDHREKW